MAAQNLLSLCGMHSEEQLEKINAIPESEKYGQFSSPSLGRLIMNTEALNRNIRNRERHLQKRLHRWRLSRKLAAGKSFAPTLGYCTTSNVSGIANQTCTCLDTESLLLRCTARIFETASDSNRQIPDNPKATWQEYELVARIINAFLREEFANTTLLQNSFNQISALHIAFFNDDFDALYELWKRFRACCHDTDFLGREIGHVLIQYDRWDVVLQIRKEYNSYIAKVGVDGRGMCLLSNAAIQGKNDLFALLRGARAKSRIDKLLLNCAVAGGNEDLVEQVVCSPSMVNQPYFHAVLEAIQLHRPGIARRLFNRHDQTCQFNQTEKEYLADEAKRRGTEDMLQLSRELLNVNIHRDGRKEAEVDTTKWQDNFAAGMPPADSLNHGRTHLSGQSRTYTKLGSDFTAFPQSAFGNPGPAFPTPKAPTSQFSQYHSSNQAVYQQRQQNQNQHQYQHQNQYQSQNHGTYAWNSNGATDRRSPSSTPPWTSSRYEDAFPKLPRSDFS